MPKKKAQNHSDKALDAKALGNVLRGIREERQMTQEELSLTGNICQSYLSHIENGGHCLSVHKLFSLMRVMDISEVEFTAAFVEERRRLGCDGHESGSR